MFRLFYKQQRFQYLERHWVYPVYQTGKCDALPACWESILTRLAGTEAVITDKRNDHHH
jgi:hypothetical protein